MVHMCLKMPYNKQYCVKIQTVLVSELESHSFVLVLFIMQCPLPSSCLLNSCSVLLELHNLPSHLSLPLFDFLLLPAGIHTPPAISPSQSLWSRMGTLLSCYTVHPQRWLASGLPLFLTQVPYFSVSFSFFFYFPCYITLSGNTICTVFPLFPPYLICLLSDIYFAILSLCNRGRDLLLTERPLLMELLALWCWKLLAPEWPWNILLFGALVPKEWLDTYNNRSWKSMTGAFTWSLARELWVQALRSQHLELRCPFPAATTQAGFIVLLVNACNTLANNNEDKWFLFNIHFYWAHISSFFL